MLAKINFNRLKQCFKKIKLPLIKKLLIIYTMMFPLFVIVALCLNHIEKYNFAKDLSFSQRNNLFIKDFRSVNTTLQSLPRKYNRIDFVINNEIQFTSINQDQPKWYYKKIQIHLYTDIEEKNELGYFIFYYNYIIVVFYAFVAWLACMLFLYPSFLVQKNLYLQNLKLNTLEAYQDLAKQVAHDLKSPLQALEVIATLPEYKKSNTQLHKIAKRIADISQDLFNKKYNFQTAIAIPTTMTINDSVEPENFNVSIDLVSKETLTSNDLLATIEQIITEKKILFHEIDFELENFLETDFRFCFSKIELERVISNIFNNSIEAIKEKLMSQKNKVLQSKVQVTLINNSTNVVIRIFDTGKGIEDHRINDLFKKGVSYKLNSQLNSGLGLYHAQKVIEDANGRIKVFSQINEFTTVEIEIPLLL